jgi:vacuolar-type H+-ATPase subunit H
VAGLRDFLLRFRPASTPGPAAAGVPADRTAELAAELQPPLALLEDTERQAQAIREAAARQAEEIRQAAERQAAEILAEARTRAGQVRQETADRARAVGEAEARRLLAAGERAAELVRRRAEERMPALVERVVADVLSAADDGRSRWAPGGSPG